MESDLRWGDWSTRILEEETGAGGLAKDSLESSYSIVCVCAYVARTEVKHCI